MTIMRWPLTLAVLPLVATVVGPSAFSFQPPDPALADSMAEKLQSISEGEAGPDGIEVSQEEFNAYIVHHLGHQLPEGVIEPWVRFNEGLIWAGAELDLDILRARMPESSMSQFLSGRVPVELSATLKAEGGVGRIELQTVTLSGIPLPAAFVEELVTANTKTPDRPNGIRMDEPFALPYEIESVRTLEGRLALRRRLVTEK